MRRHRARHRSAAADGAHPGARSGADAIAELEARKEAKYREIRDAEMDLRTGKLSAEDHRVLDRQLRAEAVEILKELDRVEPDPGSTADRG